MKILIDNGHVINTPGKRSPDGVPQKGEFTPLSAYQAA